MWGFLRGIDYRGLFQNRTVGFRRKNKTNFQGYPKIFRNQNIDIKSLSTDRRALKQGVWRYFRFFEQPPLPREKCTEVQVGKVEVLALTDHRWGCSLCAVFTGGSSSVERCARRISCCEQAFSSQGWIDVPVLTLDRHGCWRHLIN